MASPMMRHFNTIFDACTNIERPVLYGACVQCGSADGYGVSDAAAYCNDCRRKMSAICHIPDSAIAKARQTAGN